MPFDGAMAFEFIGPITDGEIRNANKEIAVIVDDKVEGFLPESLLPCGRPLTGRCLPGQIASQGQESGSKYATGGCADRERPATCPSGVPESRSRAPGIVRRSRSERNANRDKRPEIF
ncbi:hypothetical protein Trydic_g3819 [Trypoxylus dichotomus]